MMFRTACRLQSDSWGMQDHEHIMRLVELGGEYDQLDFSNCAWAEAAMRRAQTIGWVCHDKLRDDAHTPDRISPEEMAAFTGLNRAGECAVICPTLLTRVKAIVEGDANIMMQVRKTREERELRRGKPKGANTGESE